MSAKMVALILGVIFVAVGILGFIPNPLVAPGGVFHVDTAHNVVHVVTGLVLLLGAYVLEKPRATLQIVGVVYAVVAVLGFALPGDSLLGLVAMNEADRWLHVVLAVVILAAGFWLTSDEPAGKPTTTTTT